MNTHASAPTPTQTAETRRGTTVGALLRGSLSARLAGPAAVLVTVGTALSMAPSTPASATVATNCAALPSACGYPDATNTGVLAGTTLRNVPSQVSKGTGWYYDSRGFAEVNGNGAVLSGLNITGNLDISASNVTINNVKVMNSGQSSFGISLRHTSNVTIEHSMITGADGGPGRLMVGVKDVYGDSTGTVVQDNNIRYTSTGVQLSAGLIQDNYIHAMGLIPGDHVNGTTSGGGTTQLTIQHNTVFNQLNQCDAISLFQDFGPQAAHHQQPARRRRIRDLRRRENRCATALQHHDHEQQNQHHVLPQGRLLRPGSVLLPRERKLLDRQHLGQHRPDHPSPQLTLTTQKCLSHPVTGWLRHFCAQYRPAPAIPGR